MQSRSGRAAAHRLCAPAPGPRPAALGLGDTSVIPLKTERRAERSPQQYKPPRASRASLCWSRARTDRSCVYRILVFPLRLQPQFEGL